VIPFAGIAIIGLPWVHMRQLAEFNPSGSSLLHATAALAPLTMFAYLGLESATVPAGDVRQPERTIPLATILGITVAASLYVLGTVVVFGVVPRAQLGQLAGPLQRRGSPDVGRVGIHSRGAGRDAVLRSER
jgi:arginine:agmatine antiporter